MVEHIWLTPFLKIPKPENGEEVRYNQASVDRVIDFCSLLVFGQARFAGKPFVLLPWEISLIQQFYGVQVKNDDGIWVRYRRFLYNEIPKKNGKSELGAALGLYHLLADGEEDAKVGIFAADKDNADIIFKAAKYMVEHTALSQPAHRPLAWCRDSVREIRTRFGGIMKVYSSDAETKHGFSFSAILFDELHAQPNRRLWDVLTEGSDASRLQQAVLVFTTAGDDPDRTSIGWEKHEQCRKILNWRKGTPENPQDQDDPQWCPIMYGISVMTGDDPDKIAALNICDEALWQECNPSYGVTIKPRDFRNHARSARQSEAQERNFRWLRLNQWISTKAVGWVPLTIYDKTQWNRPEWNELSAPARRQAVRDYLIGKRCYGGLDLSKSTDLTAFVLIFPPQAGLDTWVVLFWAWRPEATVVEAEQRDHVPYRDWARAGFLTLCPGDTVDYSMVEAAIDEAACLYDLQVLGLDPAMSWTLSQRLMTATKQRKAIEVIEIPQTMMGLSPSTKRVEELLRKHEMLHEHNTCARWNFGNVRCAVDGNENLKPMKNRSIGRIDMTVAWVIAMAAAMLKMPTGPSINDRVRDGDWGL